MMSEPKGRAITLEEADTPEQPPDAAPLVIWTTLRRTGLIVRALATTGQLSYVLTPLDDGELLAEHVVRPDVLDLTGVDPLIAATALDLLTSGQPSAARPAPVTVLCLPDDRCTARLVLASGQRATVLASTAPALIPHAHRLRAVGAALIVWVGVRAPPPPYLPAGALGLLAASRTAASFKVLAHRCHLDRSNLWRLRRATLTCLGITGGRTPIEEARQIIARLGQ